MKPHRQKYISKALIILSLFVIAIGVYAHEEHNKKFHSEVPNDLILGEINSEYVRSVKPIFQKSCFDCHSNQTNYPWYSKIPGVKTLIQNDINEARTHLDLSKDFPFLGHGTPVTDLKSIRDQIN